MRRNQLLTIAVFDLAAKRVVELARGLHVAGVRRACDRRANGVRLAS